MLILYIWTTFNKSLMFAKGFRGDRPVRMASSDSGPNPFSLANPVTLL